MVPPRKHQVTGLSFDGQEMHNGPKLQRADFRFGNNHWSRALTPCEIMCNVSHASY